MRASFTTLLTLLSLVSAGVLGLPEPQHRQPAPGTQPGCGTKGCKNPTGLFGLKRDNHRYHALCDQGAASAQNDHTTRVCFNTQLKLKNYLSAPNPEKLWGYVDGTGTDFLLYFGQIVTLNENLEIHVDLAPERKPKHRAHGCAWLRIYDRTDYSKQIDEIWCPGYNAPVEL